MKRIPIEIEKKICNDYLTNKYSSRELGEKWNNKIINKDKKYSVIQIQKYNQVKQLATVLYMNSNIHLSRKFQMAQEILDSKS